MEDWELRMIAGRLGAPSDLPVDPPNQIKLFLSCAAADFDEERAAILTQVVPRVREEVKQKYGLEFHYMDLRNGVLIPDEKDFSTREFFLKELLRAQQLSAGTHYMALVGQKYGCSPVPKLILSDIFELIEVALKNSRSRRARGARLLTKWYKQDSNSIPAVHVLEDQAEISKLQELKIENIEDERTILLNLLKFGVEQCCKEGSLPPEAVRSYFASDFEAEVKHGLLVNPASALIYTREISDLKNYVDVKRAETFTEVAWEEDRQGNMISPDTSHLLQQLRSNLIEAEVPAENRESYTVLWRFDSGLHPVHHKQYLDELCVSAYQKLTRLCGDAASVCQARRMVRSRLIQEVMSHHQKTFERGLDCQGRDDELAKIAEYLTDRSNREYFTMYGKTGSGKTCLISKAFLEVSAIVSGKVISILRHIAHTPSSSTLKELLQGICEQIAMNLQQSHFIPADMKSLYALFNTLITSIPADTTLVLFLDSIHNIPADNNAHTLHWLPSTLPPNVKIVISVLPEKHDICNRIRTEIVRNENNFLKVTELGTEKGFSLILHWLHCDNRCLNDAQAAAVKSKLAVCSLPLYIKLIYTKISEWRSFDKVSQEEIAPDVPSYLEKMFSDLEYSNGKTLVKHSLALLTASHTGLSDMEMEDLLSMDDKVLEETIDASDVEPALRRFPTHLWAKLRDNLNSFLNLKNCDDHDIYYWSHSIFQDFVQTRYLSDKKFSQQVHELIADYYLGKKYGVDLPYTGKNGKQLQSNRKILSQPLTYISITGETRYNRRKYDQVPRHLYLAGRLDELNAQVLFNYEWMYNKIKVLSLQHILADLSLNPSVEATLLEGALRAAEPTLLQNIDNMPAELSGRLLPYYHTHENVHSLIDQCDRAGLSQCALVPAFSYAQTPGSPLKATFNNNDVIDQMHMLNNGEHLVMKSAHNQTVRKFDLQSGESIADITTSYGHLHITPDGRHLIIVDNEIEKSLKVHRSDDGVFEGHIIPINYIESKDRKHTSLGAVSITNSHAAVLLSGPTSFLCVCSFASFDHVRTFQLPGKASIIQISPSSDFILCCIGTHLYAYRMGNFEQICVTPLEYKPTIYCFTSQASKVYLSDEESNLISVISLSADGRTQMVSKIPFWQQFSNDSIRKIKLAHNQQLLAARGDDHILVYNLMTDKIQLQINRPPGSMTEFRLPKHAEATPVNYTDCQFSFDDKVMIVSFFRNVQFWDIASGTPLSATILAPVGIIRNILLSTVREQIVTLQQDATCAQVWCLENYIMDVTSLDRLSSPVHCIAMSGDSQIAFASGYNSDEIGVIDMNTCLLSNLLTHEAPIVRHLPNQDGSYLFVTIQPSKTEFCNKIWSVHDRQIIKQFGSSEGYTVALKKRDTILHLSQRSVRFLSPYHLTFFTFAGHEVLETDYDFVINHVVTAPFVTKDDTYMVLLSSDRYIEHTASYSPPAISAFYLKGRCMHSIIGQNELGDFLCQRRFVSLLPVNDKPTQIIALYEVVEQGRLGFVHIDLPNMELLYCSDDFMSIGAVISKLVVSNSGEFCVNTLTGQTFDMHTGQIMQNVVHNDGSLLVLVDRGRIAVYFSGSKLIVERLSDNVIIAKADVHLKICQLYACDNDTSVLVGCTDGSILSYAIIDTKSMNPDDVLCNVPSRNLPVTNGSRPSSEASDRPGTAQSWDLPTSASNRLSTTMTARTSFSVLPEERETLKKIRPLYRHNTAMPSRPLAHISQRSGYHPLSASVDRSQTCSLM